MRVHRSLSRIRFRLYDGRGPSGFGLLAAGCKSSELDWRRSQQCLNMPTSRPMASRCLPCSRPDIFP